MTRLRHYRLSRRIKQDCLSRASGLSQPQISRLERGAILPNIREARILSAFYGVRIEALFPDGIRPGPPRGPRQAQKPAEPPQEQARERQLINGHVFMLCPKCRTRLYIGLEGGRASEAEELSCPACGKDVYEMLVAS